MNRRSRGARASSGEQLHHENGEGGRGESQDVCGGDGGLRGLLGSPLPRHTTHALSRKDWIGTRGKTMCVFVHESVSNIAFCLTPITCLVSLVFSQVTLHVAYVHAFVNPALFLALHKGLRKAVTDIVCCHCSSVSSSSSSIDCSSSIISPLLCMLCSSFFQYVLCVVSAREWEKPW